jgi:hypothetical protein
MRVSQNVPQMSKYSVKAAREKTLGTQKISSNFINPKLISSENPI